MGPWRQKSSLIFDKGNKINKKVVAIHIDLVPKDDDPVIIFYDEDVFLLPVHDKGYWLFSFASREWDVNPGDDLVISPQDFADARTILNNISTGLSDKIMGGRVFCDNYSEDREFDITTINDSAIEISGASGSGYRLAYGLAETIARRMFDDK